jgi:hypothetical protein
MGKQSQRGLRVQSHECEYRACREEAARGQVFSLANARLPLYDVHWTSAVVIEKPTGNKKGETWRVGLRMGACCRSRSTTRPPNASLEIADDPCGVERIGADGRAVVLGLLVGKFVKFCRMAQTEQQIASLLPYPVCYLLSAAIVRRAWDCRPRG